MSFRDFIGLLQLWLHFFTNKGSGEDSLPGCHIIVTMSPHKAGFALFTLSNAENKEEERSDLIVHQNNSLFFDKSGRHFDYRLFPSKTHMTNSVESMHESIKDGISTIADFIKIRNFKKKTPKDDLPAHNLALDFCRVHYVALENDRDAFESEQVINLQTVLYRHSRVDQKQGFYRFSRDDFQILPTKMKAYFYLIGLNVLHHRLEMLTLLPVNEVSYYGMVDMQETLLQIAFLKPRHNGNAIDDELQNVRIHDPNDYEVREFPYFGRANLKNILVENSIKVASQDAEYPSSPIQGDVLREVEASCWLQGEDFHAFINGQNWTLIGTGKGKECMEALENVFAKHKRDCRTELCWLDFTQQPIPKADVLIVGSMFRAMQVLKKLQESIELLQKLENNTNGGLNLVQHKAQIKVLQTFRKQYFAPSSSNLDKIVEAACSLPLSLYAHVLRTDNASNPILEDEIEFICMDMSFLAVIIKQFSLIDEEERHFYAPIGSNRISLQYHAGQMTTTLPSIAENSMTPIMNYTDHLKLLDDAWIIGACIFFEFRRLNADSQFETDFFYAQVGDGLPIGLRLSALLLVAACLFLYYTTTGSYKKTICSSLYPKSMVQGKARQHDSKVYTPSVKKRRSHPLQTTCRSSTCSIYFLDDATE